MKFKSTQFLFSPHPISVSSFIPTTDQPANFVSPEIDQDSYATVVDTTRMYCRQHESRTISSKTETPVKGNKTISKIQGSRLTTHENEMPISAGRGELYEGWKMVKKIVI